MPRDFTARERAEVHVFFDRLLGKSTLSVDEYMRIDQLYEEAIRHKAGRDDDDCGGAPQRGHDDE